MSQNTSSAVMQQRNEPHKSLDDFPTPPWATRALCEWINGLDFYPLEDMTVREPAANRGHMVKPLSEYFGAVDASDIHDYGAGFPVQDYLFGPITSLPDWTITNPPFRLAQQFIDRALQFSLAGTAVIVRTSFLEGVGRHAELFSKTPPTDILQFSERVPMNKGVMKSNMTTATSYCWLVWNLWAKPKQPTHFHWIAPCRKRLERAEDYA